MSLQSGLRKSTWLKMVGQPDGKTSAQLRSNVGMASTTTKQHFTCLRRPKYGSRQH